MSGSFPSFCKACRTAPGGIRIFNILKNFAYSGSSFKGGSESLPSPFFVLTWLAYDFSGSISATATSLPSRSKACLTVSAGMPILSICMYFLYSGSTFNAGAVPSCSVEPAASAERLAKRAFSAAFLSGASSFSSTSAARLENRAFNAEFLSGTASVASFLCSASGRAGSRSIIPTSFPSRSSACTTA